MRARASLLLPIVLLAGCGGDDPPAAEVQVRQVLADFGEATAAKDEQRLCDDLLSRELVGRVQNAGLPCEQALRIGLQDVRAPRLEVLSVMVRNESAEARVRTSAAGQRPSTDVVQLVREGGAWRVASLVG